MYNILLIGVNTDLLEGLIDRNITIFHEAYNDIDEDQFLFKYKSHAVHVIHFELLMNRMYRADLATSVSHIVINLDNLYVEKNIEFIINLGIPLVVFSKDFNNSSVKSKLLRAKKSIIILETEHVNIPNYTDIVVNSMEFLKTKDSGIFSVNDIIENSN